MYFKNYNILDTHSVQNIKGQSFVLVFVSKTELSDIDSLYLFREFIDHIQRISIIEICNILLI